MNFKKALAGILTAVVAAGALSISAFADVGDTGAIDDFEYHETHNIYTGEVVGCAITKYNGTSERVVIPSEIDGLKVTSIDGAFEGCTFITEVIIPDTLFSISDHAFAGCTGLTEITIPDGVFRIDDYVFSGCTGLTEIVIPDSVGLLGRRTFENCTALTKIVIPDSVYDMYGGAFDGCPDDLTIYGYTGSYAETYAKENGINFVALDGDNSEAATSTEPAATAKPDTTTSTEPAATTTAANTTTAAGSTNANGTDGAADDNDNNANTGVVLLIIPAIAAAAGVIASRKIK